MQQQQHSMIENGRRNFNIAYSCFVVLQRAIIVPFRKYWGLKALGTPCFLAFGLIIAWTVVSRDSFMWLWLAIWLISLLKRRQESMKFVAGGGRIHSESDGWPATVKSNEKAAKLLLEPFIVGFLGAFLCWVYDLYGMPVGGLPSFFLVGAFALVFVEKVKEQIWNQRVQSMVDARVEQEALIRDVRERFGGD